MAKAKEHQFKTVEIKRWNKAEGRYDVKNYVPVNERILYFRNSDEYAGWSLTTEILKLEAGFCLMKATVRNDEVVIATAHASEATGDTHINKKSLVENCETSAVGRVLGLVGIGIEESIATHEEVEAALSPEERQGPPPQRSTNTSPEVYGPNNSGQNHNPNPASTVSGQGQQLPFDSGPEDFSQPAQPADNRIELTPGSVYWRGVVKSFKDGKATWDQLTQYYKLSDENAMQLRTEIQSK